MDDKDILKNLFINYGWSYNGDGRFYKSFIDSNFIKMKIDLNLEDVYGDDTLENMISILDNGSVKEELSKIYNDYILIRSSVGENLNKLIKKSFSFGFEFFEIDGNKFDSEEEAELYFYLSQYKFVEYKKINSSMIASYLEQDALCCPYVYLLKLHSEEDLDEFIKAANEYNIESCNLKEGRAYVLYPSGDPSEENGIHMGIIPLYYLNDAVNEAAEDMDWITS